MSTGVPELDRLFAQVGSYRKSSELMALYEFLKRFPRISPYNAMLIHIQKPGSNYVASASTWLSEFNRRIKPEARPLVILWPFGPVKFVFDVSDTEGDEPFPEVLLNPFRPKGTVPKYCLDNLIESMKGDGIFYAEADHGPDRAGSIEIREHAPALTVKRNRKTFRVKCLFAVVANKNHNVTTRFATILHELGHLYCGHLGSAKAKWLPHRAHLGRNVREFEAESVCWLICERMGLENPSAAYLSSYTAENTTIPVGFSIDKVLKAAGIIESMIQTKKRPRKELILGEAAVD